MYYRKFHGKAGNVHPVWYHGKAVCERQGVTNNKEFKEDKEIKKKTNDCTQNRADEERCRDCPTDTECGQSYARAVIYV